MTKVFIEDLDATKAYKAIEEAEPWDEQVKWEAMIRLADLRTLEDENANEQFCFCTSCKLQLSTSRLLTRTA